MKNYDRAYIWSEVERAVTYRKIGIQIVEPEKDLTKKFTAQGSIRVEDAVKAINQGFPITRKGYTIEFPPKFYIKATPEGQYFEIEVKTWLFKTLDNVGKSKRKNNRNLSIRICEESTELINEILLKLTGVYDVHRKKLPLLLLEENFATHVRIC